jgi:hypothetical protein
MSKIVSKLSRSITGLPNKYSAAFEFFDKSTGAKFNFTAAEAIRNAPKNIVETAYKEEEKNWKKYKNQYRYYSRGEEVFLRKCANFFDSEWNQL